MSVCPGAAVSATGREIRPHRAAALGPRLRPGAEAQEDGSLLLPPALAALRQVRPTYLTYLLFWVPIIRFIHPWCVYVCVRATLPLLKVAVRHVKAIPIVGSLLMPEYIMSVLTYLNKFHFYNSNS